jgi:hypothetical protein
MLTLSDLIANAHKQAKKLNTIIKSNIFLSGEYVCKLGEIAIYDANAAEDFICSQDLQPPYQYWIHICEKNMTLRGEIWNSLHNNGKEVRELLDELSNVHTREIMKKVEYFKFPFLLQNPPCEDFYGFLVDLTFDGHLNSFRENQLRIYREGGQPCGWKGEYPEGELLVFVREQK